MFSAHCLPDIYIVYIARVCLVSQTHRRMPAEMGMTKNRGAGVGFVGGIGSRRSGTDADESFFRKCEERTLTTCFGRVLGLRCVIHILAMCTIGRRRLKYGYRDHALDGAAAAIGRAATMYIQSHQAQLRRTATIRINYLDLLTLCHRHFICSGRRNVIGYDPCHFHITGRLVRQKTKNGGKTQKKHLMKW